MFIISGCANKTSNNSSKKTDNDNIPTFIIKEEDTNNQEVLSEIIDTICKDTVVSEIVVPDASDFSVPEGGKEFNGEVDYAEVGYQYKNRVGYDSHDNIVYEIIIDNNGNEFVFRTGEYIYDGETVVYQNIKDYIVPGVNNRNQEYISTLKLDKKGRVIDCITTCAQAEGEDSLVVDYVSYDAFTYIEFNDTDYYMESKRIEGKKDWELHVEEYSEYVTEYGKWSNLPPYDEIEKYDNGRPKSCRVLDDYGEEIYKFTLEGNICK